MLLSREGGWDPKRHPNLRSGAGPARRPPIAIDAEAMKQRPGPERRLPGMVARPEMPELPPPTPEEKLELLELEEAGALMLERWKMMEGLGPPD